MSGKKNKKMLVLLSVLSLALSLGAAPAVKGYLFIIGGGHRPESMMKRFIELTKKFGSGKIVIFPMASSVPDGVGPEEAAEFKKLGATDVEVRKLTREEALKEDSAQVLDGVGGVFFSGGVQQRLMDVLLDTPIHRRLIQLYNQGCVIGGTSAGAAVMSEVMITGDETRKVEEGHEFETLQAKNVVTTRGFGLVKVAVIDQHFATRKRHNRLVSVLAEKPALLGVGIDEATAILVRPDQTFEVIGEKDVIIYDLARAKIKILANQSIGLEGILMHVLLPGQRFNLLTRKVVHP